MVVCVLSTFLFWKISPSPHHEMLGKQQKLLLRKSFVLLLKGPLLKYFFHDEILLNAIKKVRLVK